ncbi:MAG: transporter substrate-binding domain-containing protein [Gammaproteobacteria bacterium]|nr:transporter substrate-binding domain-containing protein [Gammaproteobacteria bacterium]MCP4090783.1 transporter substrate-binding domain-containing protein [Gammaproteobacteria bacterium]MCP4277210.1 transporter substrate-binding domain-containing protein [Gammaproteobacteria bacterium]MCP4832832.1 transporter substrate-binding domain-containing protein [Gammaproteobacteria bacterium]MCP4927980.1 transporter substrate-binding domain-containing protein [Gammaproteobacteria bacterium]
MKTRFWFTKMVAAIATLMFAVTSVTAADNTSPILKRISQTNTLRIGMTGTQPPFNMKNRDDRFIGMDVDLAQLLSNEMGVTMEIVEMPFVKLLPALEDGDIDLVISGVTATVQRNIRVAFVGPYFVTATTILTKEEILESINTPEKLNKGERSIAVLKGSTSEDFVEAALNKPVITATDTYAEAIQLLKDDKVDAVVADDPICALSILRNPDAGFVTLNKPLTIEPIGIAIAPGDPLLINLVQNYMQALTATGALEIIKAKWFKNGAWMAQVP